METQIFTKENLDVAAQALQQGEIVSFPTETVYGLGAIATSQEAVLKVFEAKGRPSDNPLIVHISDIHQMTSTVEEVPEIALTLAKAFLARATDDDSKGKTRNLCSSLIRWTSNGFIPYAKSPVNIRANLKSGNSACRTECESFNKAKSNESRTCI